MLYSQNLLKKYISIDDQAKNISDYLTLKTCEIEEIIERKVVEDVVIGKSLGVIKHPEADKLFVCQIDCGPRGKFQIITGGENIIENVYVPVVLPGAYLPKIDLKIEPRKMRGIESNGMICSKNEIGINEDTDQHWIWILDEDFSDLSDSDLGKPLISKYPWLDNTIYDVDNKTLTNRPDLTGHFGIAIELLAIYNTFGPEKIKFNKISEYMQTFQDTNIIDVLQNSNKSDRKVVCDSPYLNTYILLELNNISVQRSTFLSRTLLSDLGLNPRNNWVDFSNLFVYLSGQPIHFFDAAKVNGDIIVRQAKDGEEFIDLFDTKHVLNSEDMVIADKDKILALAGIIGGKDSGVSENTKDIIVEIANFDAVKIRKTGTRLGLRTDAELRYEKTISPIYSLYVLLLFLDELKFFAKDLGEYKIGGLDSYIAPQANISGLINKKITIDLDYVQRFIFGDAKAGFTDIAVSILNSLGFEGNGEFKVPYWRGTDDINIKEDLYEEVARIFGYDNIPESEILRNIRYVKYVDEIDLNRKLENICIENFSFNQVESYPWVHKDILDLFGEDTGKLFSLQNYTAPEYKYLRNAMFYNILTGIEKNFRYFDELKIFEIGKVWDKKIDSFDWAKQRKDLEKKNMIIAIYKKEIKDWQADGFLYIKSVLSEIISKLGLKGELEYKLSADHKFHPKKQGDIYFNNVKIGNIAQLHPLYYDHFKFPEKSQIAFAELNLWTLETILSQKVEEFGFSKYESITDQIIFRDLSFVLDKDADFGKIIDAIKKVSNIVDVRVFDLYAGDNLAKDKKSIALELKILGDGKFQTADINAVMDKAISKASEAGAQLRS